MYYRIESKFKSKSWRNKENILMVVVTVLYLTFAFLIGALTGDILYTNIILPIFAVIIVYIWIYHSLKKINKNSLFWKFKSNRDIYIEERKNNDLNVLIELLKENGINTRPKVQEAIRHYQTLTSRNIVGSGLFLSVLTISISIVTFIMSENNNLSQERLNFMFAILIVIAVFYFTIKIIRDQIKSFSGPKVYEYIESLLSIIYFQSLIK